MAFVSAKGSASFGTGATLPSENGLGPRELSRSIPRSPKKRSMELTLGPRECMELPMDLRFSSLASRPRKSGSMSLLSFSIMLRMAHESACPFLKRQLKFTSSLRRDHQSRKRSFRERLARLSKLAVELPRLCEGRPSRNCELPRFMLTVLVL